MRSVFALLLLTACSSSPSGNDAGADATVDAPADVGVDAADAAAEASGDGSVTCTQTVTGDETATLTCVSSLCHPTSSTSEIIDTSSGGHIIRPAIVGTFAVGSYGAADLDVTSQFFVTTTTTSYGARAGTSPYPGQSVALQLDTVVQPSNNPCDGIVHGTADVRLVELVDGGVGPGHVDVHVVF